jgi:DNA invertase Pin-like site-specific DNA recombinase
MAGAAASAAAPAADPLVSEQREHGEDEAVAVLAVAQAEPARPARPPASRGRAACRSRGSNVLGDQRENFALAKDLKRPGAQEALRALEAGEAKALVVAKLDPLSRSMLDFAALMATAQKQNWALVAVDCAVDTSTPAGEALAHVLGTFGQFERRLIGQRTKEAMAAKKAAGAKFGRPPTVPKSIVRRIQRQRARGESLRAIAESLNGDGVPTAQGGAQWWAATVRGVLNRTT